MIEGKLIQPSGDRWFIVQSKEKYLELTSGNVLEVKIQEKWILTRIEHNGEKYYPATAGICFYQGMPARAKY